MLVVDTNVIAYLLIEGDHTKAAQELFTHDDDWHTEPFALVELSNVLVTACRSRGLTIAKAQKLLRGAGDLFRERMHSVEHDAVVAVAYDLSISAYDARFVALARQLDSTLVTEDQRLRRAVPRWTQSIADARSAIVPE